MRTNFTVEFNQKIQQASLLVKSETLVNAIVHNQLLLDEMQLELGDVHVDHKCNDALASVFVMANQIQAQIFEYNQMMDLLDIDSLRRPKH